MPRNSEVARNRMRHAALELFTENGFDQTTAAQIAERAGVTERTFFRHFPDKREVLFDDRDTLGTALSEAIRHAPPQLSAIEALRNAFVAVTPLLEGNRPFSVPRQRIVAVTPTLQEREVAKHAAMAKTVSAALEKRGIAPIQAAFAAQAGLAVFGHALTVWFGDPSLRLDDCIARAFEELQLFTAPMAGS